MPMVVSSKTAGVGLARELERRNLLAHMGVCVSAQSNSSMCSDLTKVP